MGNRNFSIQPVENWTEISENGELVATLFKTFHPTIPFEVFMKNGTGLAKRVSTIQEATNFILENSTAPTQ